MPSRYHRSRASSSRLQWVPRRPAGETSSLVPRSNQRPRARNPRHQWIPRRPPPPPPDTRDWRETSSPVPRRSQRPRARNPSLQWIPRRPPPPPPETRDWLELPRDVLALIFRKLGGIDVLWPAQAVCRPWRQLALEPEVWRCIDMRGHSDLLNQIDMEALARTAIDRSGGLVEELYVDYFGSDELLRYLADRTTGLRVLVLISAYDVSGEGLTELVGRCPLLEELQITNFELEDGGYGAIGRARPELKRFSLNRRWYMIDPLGDSDSELEIEMNDEALQIAENMPQLCELQLVGNHLTNKGLEAILNNCTHLESLDIRACHNVGVDDSLRAKLGRIKTVRLPSDSTKGYGFPTGLDDDEEDGYEFADWFFSEFMGDMFAPHSDDDEDYTVEDFFEDDEDDIFPF